MNPITIAFCGVGGYGDYCLGLLLDHIPRERYRLVGIADPYADKAPRAAWLREQGIPFYPTVGELYAAQKVDALYIASPIPCHREQCEAALAHGSAVLCEKPLVPLLQDALALREAEKKTGQHIGVGFQWSFAEGFLQAKRDILDGRWGKPVSLRSFISWQRFDDYYGNYTTGWKGRVRGDDGAWILDSVVTNATAHHLHNIFFLLGEDMASAAMPEQVQASLYRAHPIESFDTCVMRGHFEGGADFLYLSTHSGDRNVNPMLEYVFENGRLLLDCNAASPRLTGRMNSGEVVDYGDVTGDLSCSAKVAALLDAAGGKPQVLTCTVETILPHLTVCNALFDQLDIHSFPAGQVVRTPKPAGYTVTGLTDQLHTCFGENRTPREAGLSWAVEELPLRLAGYTTFSGSRYPVR